MSRAKRRLRKLPQRSKRYKRISEHGKKRRIGNRVYTFRDFGDKQKIKEALSKLTKEEKEIKRLKHGILSILVRDIVNKLFNGVTPQPTLPNTLTRAKSKELRKSKGGSILWPVSEIDNTEISECHDLIQKDFTEDSSEDEEYIPEKDSELDDQADCNITLESVTSDVETEELASVSISAVEDRVKSLDEEIEERIEETICNRTRSKLPLTDTSLEAIQEAFIPPDITKDMYDWECNDEWSDFLREFARPTQCVNDELEDDPEYTLHPEEEPDTDQEELRAMKIPREELDELLADLDLHNVTFSDMETVDTSGIEDFMESLEKSQHARITQTLQTCIDLDQDVAEIEDVGIAKVKDTGVLEVSDATDAEVTETGLVEVASASSVNMEDVEMKRESKCYKLKTAVIIKGNGLFTTNQLILLKQQIQKHIQLFTQHFLQCYKQPKLSSYADESKKALHHMCFMSACNENSYFHGENLHSCKNLISEWEKLNQNKSIIDDYTHRLCGKSCKGDDFPTEFLKIISKSDGILYPSLLPLRPLCCKPICTTKKRKEELTQAEEKLLAFGIHQFMQVVKENQSPRQITNELSRYITQHMIPSRTSNWMFSYINRKKRSPGDNYVKSYYENGKLPPIEHNYYLPMKQPLYLQPAKSMPSLWVKFVNETYKTDVPRFNITNYRLILPKE